MYHIKQSAHYAKELKRLRKSFHHIAHDTEKLLDRLEQGDFADDAKIKGLMQTVYKTRVASSDQKKGKSGGFRVIYYAITENQEIILLSIYAKAKQETISAKIIKSLLEEL